MGCEIIDIDHLGSESGDLIAGGHHFTQTARKGQNKKAKAIRESIQEKGFDLSTIPMASTRKITLMVPLTIFS